MKPVIMDMHEMSLSKEVYGSRPNIFFSLFIYGLLVLLIVAFVWTYFGELDIVVKASGTIRPNTQMAVVVNPVAGEVNKVLFANGQSVKQGDILYTVDSTQLEQDRQTFEENLLLVNHELESLKLYRGSIEAGENLIRGFNKEYSAKFDSFWIGLNSAKHGAANSNDLLAAQKKNYEETLNKSSYKLLMTETLYNSILNGENMFSSILSGEENADVYTVYKNSYLKYVADAESLNLQYNNQAKDTENNIKKSNELIEGNVALKGAVEGENRFLLSSMPEIYNMQYDEYLLQVKQLGELRDTAASNLEDNGALFDHGIISLSELEASQTALETAEYNLSDYKAQYLLNIDSELKNLRDRLTDLEESVPLNEAEKKNALETFRLDTLVSVGNQISQLENDIYNLNQDITQTQLQIEKTFTINNEIGDVAVNKAAALNQTLNQIKTTEQEILKLKTNLAKVNTQIEDSVVKAQIDGNINLYTDIIPGSYLLSGVEVLSILPTRNTVLNTNIYVSNQDIAEIKEGMTVKYDIYALPRREYGDILGNITKISEDINTEQNDLLGYYLVEADIDDKEYLDASGNGVELRIGMNVDTRIVTGRVKILYFLLEKLELMVG